MADQQTLVLLSGGIDTQSPNIAAPKGTLRDCLNFEVGTQAGYSRIAGWMPHDGLVMGPDVRDFLYIPVPLADWNAVVFEYGEECILSIQGAEFFGARTTTANVIGWTSPGVGVDGVLILAFVPTAFYDAYVLGNSQCLTAFGAAGGSITFASPATINRASTAGMLPATYSTYRSLIESQHSAAVSFVAGEQTSSIDGCFTYKNIDYVIHDCVYYYFKNGVLGDICEGHVLKNAGVVCGTVLEVTVLSGSWVAGTAAGYVIVCDFDGNTFPNDGDNITLFSASGLVNLGTVFQYDGVTARSGLRALTRSLLYRASLQDPGAPKNTDVWQRRRLSRELGYTQVGATNSIGFGPQGDSDYSIYEYSRLGLNVQNSQLQPVTTAYKFPNVAAQHATAWATINNIKAQDGAVSTCIIGGHTTILKATDFDLSEVPVGSVITGLEVVIRRRATTSATSTRDNIVRLVLPDGTFSQNKADLASRYPLVLTDAVYGGATDNWGVQLSRDMLNDVAFGVHFEAFKFTADTTSVDDIKLRVTYVPATRLVYIRDAAAAAPSDIEARVVHYTVDKGGATTADQIGTLTLWIGEEEYQGTAAGKARRIGAGEEIRTASGGGGTLLAKTTAEDVPTSFPSGAAVDAKQAKWQFELANFYADPAAQMVFACNGTEYAWMYDEQYSVRIRTGRRQDLDTPRHIANHLNFMHFGFDSGDVITSATFRPLTVDPALGSQLRNVGEPIVGLRTMNGQTLGVWTKTATRGYQGTAPQNYMPIVISPAIGAIEYTVTNLAGVPMWTSARGVESASTISAYGDFSTDPLSFNATEWLQDRVQFDSRFGLVDKRPVMAVAVRNKRQYRLFFRDGYVFTVTLFGLEDIPMLTIQRLERGAAPTPYNQAPIRNAFVGVRDDGKETILCAFDRQNGTITNNFDYEGAYPFLAVLDVGRTFNTALIPAYIELNPIYPSIPTQEQQAQYVFGFANAHPGTLITQYSIQRQDTPLLQPGVGIGKRVQPAETITYIPFPNYSISFDTAKYGPFLRLRYDMSAEVCESARMTHLVLSSTPQMLQRT